MAEQINMPAGFGGLMRYNEEYESKFKIEPFQVIAFAALVLIFVVVLKLFFPIHISKP